VLGGLLALLSAATFAFNDACARRGVLTGSATQAMAITVPIGVPLFLLVIVASGHLETVFGFSSQAVFWLALAGVIHFIWGRYWNYRASQAIGSNLVGPVQQLGIVVTLVLAVWVLDEILTPLRLIGIALVIIGPALTHPRRRAPPPNDDGINDGGIEETSIAGAPRRLPIFRPRYAEGYLFALLSSVGYGVSPIFIRLALENKGPGFSLSGGMISYLAATIAFALILFRPGQMREILAVRREPAKWFTFSGILVCLSQMFRYMALAIAPVSVVTPIQRLSIVFRLVFSWLLNREHEVFGGRVLLGILVSLIGAASLSVSTEFVLATVPLPDFIVEIARWRWP
jgi:uncharacterized membrane protein